MTYSTIYDMNSGHIITDGVQSQAVCDATINTAQSLAAQRGHSVIVEDRGAQTFKMPDTSTFVLVVTASGWFGSFGCGNEIRTQVRATEGVAKEFVAQFQ